MGTIVAKVKNDDQWHLVSDQVRIQYWDDIDLTDSMVYDPNNQIAHQWFRIEELRHTDYFNPLFRNTIESGELQTINACNLDDIKFFAYFCNEKFYIQRMLRGCYIKKAGFWSIGESIQFSNDNKMVTINAIPDGIYDVNNDMLYFQELNRLYNVFPNIRQRYMEGTEDVVSQFLGNDIVSLGEGFSADQVSASNRKRISMVVADYNAYSLEQKTALKEYINISCGEDLEYDPNRKIFKIGDDRALRLLLYGMQMRFYKQPLNQEVQVATSTTSINKLK